MSKHLRGILLIIAAIVLVFFIVQKLVLPTTDVTRLDYSAFYQKLEHNQVNSFHATGYEVTGDLTNGTHYATTIPVRDSEFVGQVMQHVKGSVQWEMPNNTSVLASVLSLAPFIVLALFLFIILASGAKRRKPGIVIRPFASKDAL